VGLKPFAGALALGVHNTGVLGKLYADFLEDTDPMTTEAVASSGATRFQAVCHGMVPQISDDGSVVHALQVGMYHPLGDDTRLRRRRRDLVTTSSS